MNIGFMGGTFSPPHIGHLHSAKVFMEEAKLDRLIIIPAKVSPFKVNSEATASDFDRFEMSRLCFLSLNNEKCRVEVSDIEMSKDKTSYTVETVTELRKCYPDDTIYMFVGSDMFLSLERWKAFEEIFRECRIYTRCRDNSERNAMLDTARKYRLKYGADVVLSEDNALIASSTEVREALGAKNMESCRNLLTEDVLGYIIKGDCILKNETYYHIPTSVECLGKIREALPSFLSGKRLVHTFSVEKEALRLAKILFPFLGVDEKYLSDISAAALLHDITKYLTAQEQNELCEKYDIPVDESSRENTAVLHSRTAPYIAREKFGINDIVFGAIFCHTTGKENMNIFEKIIFIADYIEETRIHESCLKAREYFYSHAAKDEDLLKVLDMTIIMSLDATLFYLESTNSGIDSETIKARDFLLAEYALQRSVQE